MMPPINYCSESLSLLSFTVMFGELAQRDNRLAFRHILLSHTIEAIYMYSVQYTCTEYSQYSVLLIIFLPLVLSVTISNANNAISISI